MKIFQLPQASLPLSGTEEVPISQSGITVRADISALPLNASQMTTLINSLSSGGSLSGSEIVTIVQGGNLVTTTASALGSHLPSGTNYEVLIQESGVPTWSYTLFSADGNPAINFNYRVLLDDSGFSASVDWANRVLLDSTPGPSVDWTNRVLKGSSDDISVDWSNRVLKGISNNTTVDWYDLLLLDSSSNTAINWQNRQLLNTSETTVLYWNTTGIALDSSNAVSFNGTADPLWNISRQTYTDAFLTGGSAFINLIPQTAEGWGIFYEGEGYHPLFEIRGDGSWQGGDLTNIGHNTVMTLNDPNQTVIMSGGPGVGFQLSYASGIGVTIGDVNSLQNMTSMFVNDNGKQILMYGKPSGASSLATALLADFTGAGVNVSIGDISGVSNSTTLTVDDVDQKYLFGKPTFVIDGVTYVFPSSQGGASTTLINDGEGGLSWGSGAGLPSGTNYQVLALNGSASPVFSSVLNDGNGINSLDWSNRFLLDSTGAFAVSWSDRTLRSHGFTNIDWSGAGIVLIGDPGGDQNNTSLRVHDDTKTVDVYGQFLSYGNISFTGTGLNDMTSGGVFTGPSTTTFTVTIDALTPLTILVEGVSGTPPNPGDPFTTGNEATGIIISMDYESSLLVISLTSGSYINGDTITDSANGWSALMASLQSSDPDTYTWTDGTTTTHFVSCSSGVPLSHGMTNTFASATGHTLGDQWTFTVTVGAGRLSSVDFLNNIVQIGDIDSQKNGTVLTVDIPDQRLTFTGNQVTINNVPYAFPSSQGTAGTTLVNDGSGNLSWVRESLLSNTLYAQTATAYGILGYTPPVLGTYRVDGWINVTVISGTTAVFIDFMDSHGTAQGIQVLSVTTTGYRSFTFNANANSTGTLQLQTLCSGTVNYDIGGSITYAGY